MEKAVRISIKPKWCEMIASGEKTIEVRKTCPNLATPFKCYIYCTSIKYMNLDEYVRLHRATDGKIDQWHGKVIGEFICDATFPIRIEYSDPNSDISLKGFPGAGMTDREIINYLGNGKKGYCWHISKLKIYDEPKELIEFRSPCDSKCDGVRECSCCRLLTRPPQSWSYVNALEEL